MDSISVSVSGNKAIVDNLDAFGADMQANIQSLLEQAGQMAKDIADPLTPVDTGYLLSRTQVYVNPGDVTLSNDAPYAPDVILGHHTRSGSFVPPNDFLTPGFYGAGDWLQGQYEGLLK